jgi:DNA polymerase (family 10)
MALHNTEMAARFNRLAELLEIQGANPFRIRAYRNAARTLEGLSQRAASMLGEGQDLSTLPGIGKDLAGKIQEMVETGRLRLLEEVQAHVPAGLVELLELPGLGPKRVKFLYEHLGVQNLKDLERAVQAGKISRLSGFGLKTEDHLREELGRRAKRELRIRLALAEPIAESFLRYIRTTPGVTSAVIAGSYRRRKETVGDIDILAAGKASSLVMERFVAYDEVDRVVAKGKSKSTVLLHSGLQVDLLLVPEDSFGSALLYFTGSKAHNIAVRTRAVKQGLKVNEYGVFRGETRLAGRTEEEVYRAVGLPYIEPELRENWGEVETAQQGRLPKLVTLEDLRGDLHVHSKASDGNVSIEDMARAARDRGYEYLAITDHTKHVTIANGLDEKRLARQIDEIDRLNATFKRLKILKSAEVDILDNGKLDLSNEILKRLDLTVCSIHYKFKLPRAKQTERVIRAMDNPYFTIFAHPSGRMIPKREPYEIDMERLMAAALERGCFFEVNAQPVRLDLTDVHCKMAKDMGMKVVISTDAHRMTDLDLMRFGIGQVRRGWLEADDVLNTKRWPELQKLFKRV